MTILSTGREIVEITALHKKEAWMRRHVKEYTGPQRPLTDEMFCSRVKFFEISEAGEQVGFIRINNKTAWYPRVLPGEAWSIANAHVRPEHRHQWVLQDMISFVVANCHVKMIHIETDRIIMHRQYYSDLGFTYIHQDSDGVYSWAYQTSFEATAKASGKNNPLLPVSISQNVARPNVIHTINHMNGV